MMIFLKYCKNIVNPYKFGAGILIMLKPKVRSIFEVEFQPQADLIYLLLDKE